jgi:hypothetical protein
VATVNAVCVATEPWRVGVVTRGSSFVKRDR